MTLKEAFKGYKKEYVYSQYTRIIVKFKDYERISKNKMLDEIIKFYSNPENIINMCTIRELKLLSKLIKMDEEKLKELAKTKKSKYEWELDTLAAKFIIINKPFDNIYIPEELESQIKEAFKKINWKSKEKIDNLNEILVGYAKTQGVMPVEDYVETSSKIIGVSEELIYKHISDSSNFFYYVYVTTIKGEVYLVYQTYYEIIQEIIEAKEKYKVPEYANIDANIYKTIFYNRFDISNPLIKDLLDEINKLEFGSWIFINK